MNDSIFDVIRPYLQFEEQKQITHTTKMKLRESKETLEQSISEFVARATRKPIEINTATADELQALNGIGEVFSSRIVKYRQLLGGFSRLE
ncbi:helix-hairpin-helix domain-containing protein [uncultured Sunxiuqinia sp.]|uniref:ComEA family DNA-binding protein n=1 Tax=uncultured Sunxiuqinia sp. TaxID=1573825 RepID=UPI0030DCB793|tara:strand:+ start:2149 stop:2421 length:273 start_codon:yes stop_codon:yes gene_type:complete